VTEMIKFVTTLFAILFLAFIGISILGIVITGDIFYAVPIIISVVGLYLVAIIWDFMR
jgi:hypothetical protein